MAPVSSSLALSRLEGPELGKNRALEAQYSEGSGGHIHTPCFLPLWPSDLLTLDPHAGESAPGLPAGDGDTAVALVEVTFAGQ